MLDHVGEFVQAALTSLIASFQKDLAARSACFDHLRLALLD